MVLTLKPTRFQIKLRFWPIVLYLCMLTLLISLGCWQLTRAKEKRIFLQMEAERINGQALLINEQTDSDLTRLRYRKAKASGSYDTVHQFLLDNQVYHGKAGYSVLTPFILHNSNRAIIVNRGWVPQVKDRSILPDVRFSADIHQVSGRINAFPGVGIKLEGADIPSEQWPSVVQVAVAEKLADRLGYSVLPFQLELDDKADDGYMRDWKAQQVIPPEKHVAYAMQWFGLALTLTVLFIWITIKKEKHD